MLRSGVWRGDWHSVSVLQHANSGTTSFAAQFKYLTRVVTWICIEPTNDEFRSDVLTLYVTAQLPDLQIPRDCSVVFRFNYTTIVNGRKSGLVLRLSGRVGILQLDSVERLDDGQCLLIQSCPLTAQNCSIRDFL